MAKLSCGSISRKQFTERFQVPIHITFSNDLKFSIEQIAFTINIADNSINENVDIPYSITKTLKPKEQERELLFDLSGLSKIRIFFGQN